MLLSKKILLVIIVLVSSLFIYPIVNGQTYGIDNGLLQIPVKRDGQISQGEYADAAAYRFIAGCAGSGCLPQNATGFLYVKHDGNWTYFGLDFLSTTTAREWDLLSVYFDTWNAGATWNSTTSFPPGVYYLELAFSGNVYYETDEFYYIRGGNASFMLQSYGTTFKSAFPSDNCQHYCWQSFFGSSGADSARHQQFEFQIRNSVLYSHALNVQHVNVIGLIASFVDSKGAYNIPFLDNTKPYESVMNPPSLSFVPMKLVDQAVPEFASTTLLLVVSVIAVIAIVKKVRRPISDSDM